MDNVVAIPLIWFAFLLLLMWWAGRHEWNVRSLPTTYRPHPSHFVLRLYLALTIGAFAISFALRSSHPGPLLLLLLALWHLWMAFRLLWGWLRGINIKSAD